VLIDIWQCITSFALKYYEFLDIVTNIASIILAIWLFLLGADKVNKIYFEYVKHKEHALFNFYAQLDALLIEFDCLISREADVEIDEKEPNNILYYLWLDPAIPTRETFRVSYEAIKLLHSSVEMLLDFFRKATDQIPPKLNEAEFKQWIQRKRVLIFELNTIFLSTTPDTYMRGGSYNEDEVIARYKKMIELITYFQGVISDEYEMYRTEAEEEQNKQAS
jgi:hypothetical protein